MTVVKLPAYINRKVMCMATIEVDLAAIEHNICVAREKLGTGTKICAVVKANAYGHGAIRVSKFVEPYVDFYGVATFDEAYELADSGISKEIIVLIEPYRGQNLPFNVVPHISGMREIKNNDAVKRVAIKVNTGMNRGGCAPNEVYPIFEYAIACGLVVTDVYTHLYNSDSVECCDKQLTLLRRLLDLPVRVHCGATGVMCLPERFVLDAVRLGCALYGYGARDLVPAMRVCGDVVSVRKIKKGDNIGYGVCVAKSDMCIAEVMAGYADGIDSKFTAVSINSCRCNIVGRICMDVCFVDVTNCKCNVGDRAYFLGNGIVMREICERGSTSPREVLTTFKGRYKYVYCGE